MKKMFLMMAMALVCTAAMAQDNAALGKKWYDAERYEKALPYLLKAIDEGDADSKARLGAMIYTMNAMEYSMDRDQANKLLDEAIEAGSVLGIERKGFCLLFSPLGEDTPEARMNGINLLVEASEKGSSDASFNLFKVYRDGLYTYADNAEIVAPNDSLSLAYIQRANEQGGVEGKAWVGLYTYEGSHGYDKDEAGGAALIEEAWDQDAPSGHRMFAGNCLEPGRVLVTALKGAGKATKAGEVEALIDKYHPAGTQN